MPTLLAAQTRAKTQLQHMYAKKQDIYTLGLETWADYSNDQFLEMVENSPLQNYSSWLLPQLVAHFGRWRIYSSPLVTVQENTHNPLDKTLYRLTRVRRSLLIKNQTQQPEYGQLTPLILCGLRQSQNQSYVHWRNHSELKWVLEPLLYASLIVEIPQLTNQELLQIRQQGLVYRTGPKAGTTRPPESTWKLYGISDTPLGDQTILLQSMLCQIWLAHPKNRRSTMILDPNNWDAMPPALVSSELFEAATLKIKPPPAIDQLPWDLPMAKTTKVVTA